MLNRDDATTRGFRLSALAKLEAYTTADKATTRPGAKPALPGAPHGGAAGGGSAGGGVAILGKPSGSAASGTCSSGIAGDSTDSRCEAFCTPLGGAAHCRMCKCQVSEVNLSQARGSRTRP